MRRLVAHRIIWALSHESACFRAQLNPSPVELLMLMPRSGGRNEVSVVKNALVSDHWVAKGMLFTMCCLIRACRWHPFQT